MAKIETPRPIRGTQDIFGPEAEAFAHVVETFERVRKLYRFRRIEMPAFEKTEAFSRSLGETTDVVAKEMYSFEDRGGESLTLRPEFTAGIARAYLTDGWQQYAPLKVAPHGPLFRYARPQKGRYRQFHQLDAEIIGASEPQAGVELLVLADQLLKKLGITAGLDASGVACFRLSALFRVLFFFLHTAFEFGTDRLGAQGTVLGGGRYDGLIETLGGPHTPAVGWAAGIARLAMLVDAPAQNRDFVALVVENDAVQEEGIRTAAALRRAGIAVEILASGSPRKRYV